MAWQRVREWKWGIRQKKRLRNAVLNSEIRMNIFTLVVYYCKMFVVPSTESRNQVHLNMKCEKKKL